MATHLKYTKAVVRMLRNQASNAFFTGSGWSRDPMMAKLFTDLFDAAKACVQHQLAGVELVVRAEPDGADLFQLPLR